MQLSLIVCLVALSVSANLMAVDMGSENIKVAASFGRGGIGIVLNEQSRRKSSNFIGFRDGERFLGDDAKNLAARFPFHMVPAVAALVGVGCHDDAVRQYAEGFENTARLSCDDTRDVLKVELEGKTYFVDDLYAMLLQYAKGLAMKETNTTIVDVVLVVPHDDGLLRREALGRAASVAGLNVVAMISPTAAEALYFGTLRSGFGDTTVSVAIVDVGAMSTSVGVWSFHPPKEPPKGRIPLAAAWGTLRPLAEADDNALGGRSFDMCIAKIIEDRFVNATRKPRVLGGDSLHQRKAVFALLRAATNAKEMLSANQVAPISVEGLALDYTFTTTLSRQEFESHCNFLAHRVADRVMATIASSGLAQDDIQYIEIVGGAVRIPMVQAALAAALGRTPDRTLNGDEAAVLGAVYQGARIVSYMHVRSFALTNPSAYNVTFIVDESAPRSLFKHAVSGARRSITLHRERDFVVRLQAGSDTQGMQPLVDVAVGNFATALKLIGYDDPPLVHPNNSLAVRVAFKWTEWGTVAVEEAEVRFRYATNRTVRRPGPDGDDNATEAVKVFEVVMRKKSHPLTVQLSWSKPIPATDEDVNASRVLLDDVRLAEQLRQETAASKNALATRLQRLTYDIFPVEEFLVASNVSEDERQRASAAMKEIREWLEEGEGAEWSCTKERYEAQSAALTEAAGDIEARYNVWREPPVDLKKSGTKKSSKKKSKRKGKKASKSADSGPKEDVESADAPITEETEPAPDVDATSNHDEESEPIKATPPESNQPQTESDEDNSEL